MFRSADELLIAHRSSLIAAPATVRTALVADGTVLLDAASPDPDSGRSEVLLFAGPVRAIVARTIDEVLPALREVDAALAAGHWVAGWIAYEAGYAFEERLGALARSDDGALLWFGVYDAPVRVEPAELAAALGTPAGREAVTDVEFRMSRAEYTQAVETIREHIAAGDVYQANLTVPLRFNVRGEPAALYARLRANQPAPYAAMVNGGGRRLLSLSPELFFRIDGRTITARPMKGTAPRDTDGALLAADPKNRAENLMIVDLLRNDLSRVSLPGSVVVPAMFEVEPYPTVWQMTSTVRATLSQGTRLSGVLRALFPCGSVTGAPKIRAMEIIRGLEVGPRGAYCGALGFAAPDGTAVFSVPIRTIELVPAGHHWNGTLGLGSGVVWDSQPDEEFEECLLKGRFLTALADEQDPS